MNILETVTRPNRSLLFLLICLLFSSTISFAQISNMKQGKLANGLTYYIVGDKTFTNEVNFFLYQNVGAILEEDKEQGIAHFLEHMAFNSTTHFPDGVMSYLRKNGLGAFNATTGINETQYVIYNIDTDNAELINNSLLILRDWCDGILIKPEEVEKERNIIKEEWRVHRNVNKRLSEDLAKPLYNYSKYSYRNVIGTEEGIKSISAKKIKDFYDKWYNPDLQCVVIAGDINPEQYEKKIKEVFSSIPKPKTSTPRTNLKIEDNLAPIYHRFIDKENVSNSFGIYQRINQNMFDKVYNESQQKLFSMLFNQLVKRRLAMLRNDGEEAYIAATAEYFPLVRLYSQNSWDVVPYEGQELEALTQILTFREDIKRNGFQEDEFEEVRENIYHGIKSTLEGNRPLGTPDNYMVIFKQNYLYQTPLEDFKEHIRNLADELLEMDVEDLNEWKDMWMSDKNLSFITYSSVADKMNISLQNFNQILKESKTATIATAKKLEPIQNLIDFEINKGKVVSEKPIEELKAEEWILSNGAKILYKHIPDMGNETYFMGSAFGGRSLVEPKDLPSYKAMTSLIMRSGLYRYSRNQLHYWIKDKDLDLSLDAADYTDGIGGRAGNQFVEDFFKYLHLVITKQNFDKNVFEKYVQKNKYVYKNKKTEGMAAVQDSIQELLFPYAPNNPKEDIEFYNRMKQEDLSRLFDDRYGDASQFTFCLITSIEKAKAKEIIEKYIASLPGYPEATKRSYKVIDKSSPEQEIIKEFLVDEEANIGEIEIAYINDKELSAKEQKALPLIENILNNKFFEQLREKEGGIYSIGVKINYEALPVPRLNFNIHYSTESSKVDKLKKLTYQIIDEVANNNFSKEEFNTVYIPSVLSEDVQKKDDIEDKTESSNPLLWVAILNAYAEKGKIKEPEINEVSVRTLTKEDVATTLKTILNGAKHRDIVVKSIPQEKRAWKLHHIK